MSSLICDQNLQPTDFSGKLSSHVIYSCTSWYLAYEVSYKQMLTGACVEFLDSGTKNPK